MVRAGKQFEQLATNDLGERTLASYAVVDGSLLIRTEGHLYRISNADAKQSSDPGSQ